MAILTSSDARRHIRAIQRMFRSVDYIERASLEAYERKCHAKKYFKQSVRRLVRGGFLKEQESGFLLTTLGRLHLKVFPNIENSKLKKEWDGMWRIISFDIPEADASNRRRLRDILHGSNFEQLQKNIWVHPHVVSDITWKFIVDLNLDRYCVTLVADIIEGGDVLLKRFKLNKR